MCETTLSKPTSAVRTSCSDYLTIEELKPSYSPPYRTVRPFPASRIETRGSAQQPSQLRTNGGPIMFAKQET
jgi:hypothetical protein